MVGIAPPSPFPRQWKGRVLEFHLGPVSGDSDEWSYLNGQSIKDPSPLVRGGRWSIVFIGCGRAQRLMRRSTGVGPICSARRFRKKGDGTGCRAADDVARATKSARSWQPFSAVPGSGSLRPIKSRSNEKLGADGTTASVTYEVIPGQPVRFVAGYGSLAELAVVDDHLEQAETAYAQERVRASGAFGDFASIIPEWTRMLALYGEKPGTLGACRSPEPGACPAAWSCARGTSCLVRWAWPWTIRPWPAAPSGRTCRNNCRTA